MGRIRSAIKQLRRKLGDTQPAFASRLGLSVSAIAIYEKDRKPTMTVLAQLMRLAHSHGFVELATAFQEELEKELGHPVLRIAPSTTVHVEPDELEEVDALLTMLRMFCSSEKSRIMAEYLASWRRSLSESIKAWNGAREYRLADEEYRIMAEYLGSWRNISEPFKAWNRAREYHLAATGGLVRHISDRLEAGLSDEQVLAEIPKANQEAALGVLRALRLATSGVDGPGPFGCHLLPEHHAKEKARRPAGHRTRKSRKGDH